MEEEIKGVEMQAKAIVACWVAICVLGIISNVIQTLLMTCKSERETSHAIYLTALALADNCVLLIKVSEGAVFLALLDTKVALVHTKWKAWTSAIVTAINVAAQCSSAWILVAIAIDRIIVLSFPLHRQSLCSRHRALWVTAFLVVIPLLLHVPFLGIYSHQIQVMNTTVALPRNQIAIIVTNQLPFGACDPFALWIPNAAILQALSSYLAPSAILLPLCGIITFTLIGRNQNLPLIFMTDRLTAERIRKQNQLAIILFILLCKFFVVSLPYSIVLLLFYVFPNSAMILTGMPDSVPQSALTVAPNWLLLCSLEILVLLSRASHVWVLFGNAYFRRLFYQLVCVERTHMNASLTSVSLRNRDEQRIVEDSNSQPSQVGKQVLGLRVSSNKSSFRFDSGSTETVTPDAIRGIFEVDMDPSHLPDIRPTEIVLKETAKRLSIIVENSKL